MKKMTRATACLAGTMVCLSCLSTAKADLLTDTYAALTGPVTAGVQYSDLYGVILQGQLTQGFTAKQAASLEGEIGLNNRRLNLGWGYALTSQQRIKLAAEHLSQFMKFNFSSGEASRWISQNAIGVGYQYLIPGSFINDVNANIDYSKSISDNLSPRNVTGGGSIQRHLSGARNVGVSVGTDITPTYGTVIGILAHYDNVDYEVRYEGSDNDKGLGATLTLQQLMTRHLKLNLLASHRIPYQDYQGGISWLSTRNSADQMELGFDIERIIGKNRFKYDDTRFGVTFTYAWNANTEQVQNGYQLTPSESSSDLPYWVSQPAVYLKQVLARSDQD